MRLTRGRSGIRVMVVVLGAASLVTAAAGPARASTTCTLDGATLSISAIEDDVSITRSGSNFSVSGDGSAISCGGATVTNVDQVEIAGTHSGDIEIDLSNGAFAPGDTAESSGTSEIEFLIDWDPCDGCYVANRLRITGSSGADQFRFSEPDPVAIEAQPQVNLNSDSDIDVTLVKKLRVTVVGGAGNDVISGAGNLLASPQQLSYPRQLRIFGEGGDDQLTGGASFDEIDGGANDDTMFGVGGSDRFVGSPGVDSASGGSGNDEFDQTQDLDGGTTFSGGDGSDQVHYFRGSAPISITLDGEPNDGESGEGDNIKGDVEEMITGSGNDILVGNGLVNILSSGQGDDHLTGGGGADQEDGSHGNDTFHQGPTPDGADVIVEQHGVDVVDYSERTTRVSVSLDGVANDGGTSEGDNVAGENVLGGAGNDDLAGDIAANSIAGGPGNDRIAGGGGTDVLDGGTGTDIADYGDRTDDLEISLDGEANDGAPGENDFIMGNVEGASGGSGRDEVNGNARTNRLYGGIGKDKLTGADGDDHLYGGLGDDMEFGNGGNDVFYQGGADDGSDEITGGRGRDTVDYRKRRVAVDVSFDGIPDDGDSDENDDVAPDVELAYGGTGRDTLEGNGANNVLSGGRGPDSLSGKAGADRLLGGGGDDSLNGGTGRDACLGGAGRNTLRNCE